MEILQNMGSMEAAVVPGILKFLSNKLARLLTSEYGSVLGATNDLVELRDLVERVNSWLETGGTEVEGSWLKVLKDVAYAVDNFVDEFQLKAQKHEASSVVSKYICTIPKSFVVQGKVKEIKNRFAAIANCLPAGRPVRDIYRESHSFSDVPSIFGREDEKNDLISKLVETNDEYNMIVVSIIGLGGLGKTTLAQLVYNDHNIIQKHFEVKLWVHLSQEFEIMKHVGRLFESITAEPCGEHSLWHMSETISRMLMSKRYLLILDDAWMEDRFQWERFLQHVKNGAPGSRILLTTRSKRVAEAVGSTYIFDLALLSQEVSWILFKQCFATPIESLGHEFIEAGKEIVKKCAGLPLAIKVVAYSLSCRGIEVWHAMRDHSLIDFEENEHAIFTSLMLSYLHMPSHLKQCFAICSVFPKGYRIDKEKLIDLWISHDMITPEISVEYLEDIGHDCFNYLLQISFLQDVSEEYGRVTCTMHDLVHDLARTIVREEISLVLPEVATRSTKRSRYFSITEWPLNFPSANLFEEARAMYVEEGDSFKFGSALRNAKHLHSITVKYTKSVPTAIFKVKNLKYLEISGLKCEALPEAISDIWSLQALQVTDSDILNLPKSIGNLHKLRTLNLSWCKQLKSLPGSISNCHMISNMDLSGCIKFEVLPDFIGTIKRLRVLRISHTKIKRLPSSITSLRNLEYLDLQQCPELVELPGGLENLKKLEALNLEGCPKLRAMLVGIRQLRQQKNLNILMVGKIEKSAKISELWNIKGIVFLMNPGDAQKACLKDKTDLQTLQLHWGRNATDKMTNMEDVLNDLEPPAGIKVLYVSGYAGGQYAQWMQKQVGGGIQKLSQFPCLTVMSLFGLANLEHLDGLMGLPCLEELDLRWIPSLKSISGGPFPSLVKLRIEGLRSLEELWITEGTLDNGEEGKMQIGTSLSELHIEECPKLMVKPFFPRSLGHLVLQRSNEQLLLLPGQDRDQGPSSSSTSSFPPSCSFSRLKELELWGMTASWSSPQPAPESRSKREWELLQHMTSLESLRICQCGGLTELPESTRSLTSLRSLFINFCSGICMLPKWIGELRSLQKMTIQSCHSLSSFPQSMGHLTSLQELGIQQCDELHELPKCLGDLPSLRKFGIAGLRGLTCLPKSMRRLTSLVELEVKDCQGITSMPEWIRGLPALQKLKITGCSDLEMRCEREKGEDWHLINHIPRLQIGLDEEGPAC